MKAHALFIALALAGVPLLAADSSPKDEVNGAAKKLAEQPNYSWRTTVEAGGGFAPGPTEGKTEKDGVSLLSMTLRDEPVEAVLKGGKGAVKMAEGWQSLAEASEGEGRGRFIGRMFQTFKTPAAQAEELSSWAKELKKSGEAFVSQLTEEGVKQLLTFGRRRLDGEAPPPPKNAKGSVKFWVKDGVLSKYEFRVQGTVRFNENEFDVDRTTTVEIKHVGSTKIEVPEAAKKKLS